MKSAARTLTPGVRTSPPCIIVAVLLAFALASAPAGPWVEDSVCVYGREVGSLAYNPLTDVVYGASGGTPGAFFAIDCATSRVISLRSLRDAMCVVYDSVDHKAYCTYSHKDSILVVDGRTHQRIRSVRCNWATGLAWDGMRDRLYVSCGTRNVVAVFDCARDSLICEIPVDGDPVNMYVNGRCRKLYVVNREAYTVSIVDLVQNRVATTLPVGRYAFKGHYSPNANKFYSEGNGRITVIDGTGDKILARLDLPVGHQVLSYAENGSAGVMVFGVSSADSSYVQAVSLTGDSLLGGVRCAHEPQALLPMRSGGYFCAATARECVVMVSDSANRVLGELTVGEAPFVLAYSPQSRRLFVGHLGSDQVYVIRDEVGGIAEGEGGGVTLPRGAATVVRGVLNVPRDMTDFRSGKPDRVPRPRVVLLDISGRKVLDLVPGPNDVSHLSPGVYFIHSPIPSRRSQPAMKVVVQR